MTEDNGNKMPTIEKAALGTSGAILLVLVVYWVIQIGNVIEMLELAYG